MWPVTGVWAGGLSGSLVPFLLFWLLRLAVLSTTTPFLQAFLCCGDRLRRQTEKGTQPERNGIDPPSTEMPEAGLYREGWGWGHWSEQRGDPEFSSFSASLEVPGTHSMKHIPLPCHGPDALHRAPRLTPQLLRCPSRIQAWRIQWLLPKGNFWAWWWVLWGLA